MTISDGVMEELRNIADWFRDSHSQQGSKRVKSPCDITLRYQMIERLLRGLADGEIVMHEDRARGRVSYSISIEEAEEIFPRLLHQ